ncbi:MAG: hypothetical protein EOM00_12915 [Clostridia bacterium]|nr:hypothetical protein [Clostridia bacterium]
MDDLIFQDDNQLFTVKLKREVYSQMISYCGKSNPYETGGVLIGNYSTNQTTANIMQTTLPPMHSIHQKYSFHRRSTGLKIFFDQVWDRGQYYLGEWHYHPNSSAGPSDTDLKQMLLLSNHKKLKCPEPILLIIGGNSKDWQIYVSVFINETNVCLKQVK